VEALIKKGKLKINLCSFQSFARKEHYKFFFGHRIPDVHRQFKESALKKTSPVETNPPEIPETTAKPVEDDAVEPDKDQVSELRQMFDILFLATSAQSD
jgi:hypothetical protein